MVVLAAAKTLRACSPVREERMQVTSSGKLQ